MLRSSKGAAAADAEGARYSCHVRFADIEPDLDVLIGKAVTAVASSTPSPDAILGDFVDLASLIRSVSFHEGKLLEQAIIAIGQRNADLFVLWQSLRLPVTPAALEAIAHNRSGTLQGLSFDADARTRVTYTPDLVVVNRRYRSAVILDVKRSVASYLDTHRLTELKTRMLATSLILPDWLYKEHKRLAVDTVGIAIVDGGARPATTRMASGRWTRSTTSWRSRARPRQWQNCAAALAWRSASCSSQKRGGWSASTRTRLGTCGPVWATRFARETTPSTSAP